MTREGSVTRFLFPSSNVLMFSETGSLSPLPPSVTTHSTRKGWLHEANTGGHCFKTQIPTNKPKTSAHLSRPTVKEPGPALGPASRVYLGNYRLSLQSEPRQR